MGLISWFTGLFEKPEPEPWCLARSFAVCMARKTRT